MRIYNKDVFNECMKHVFVVLLVCEMKANVVFGNLQHYLFTEKYNTVTGNLRNSVQFKLKALFF